MRIIIIQKCNFKYIKINNQTHCDNEKSLMKKHISLFNTHTHLHMHMCVCIDSNYRYYVHYRFWLGDFFCAFSEIVSAKNSFHSELKKLVGLHRCLNSSCNVLFLKTTWNQTPLNSMLGQKKMGLKGLYQWQFSRISRIKADLRYSVL